MATDTEQKIIKQVEYYFGDINLPKDRFLQEEIKKDDGWITLETMTKFNRLRVVTVEVAEIAAALKKSTSGLIEISENDLKIRRSQDKPMPQNTDKLRQEIAQRTCYAKAFPLDSTLDELEAFFNENWGIECLYLRRDEKKEFKGSVFVTFKKLEDVEKFVKAESVKYKDDELEFRKTKSDYYKGKSEEKKMEQGQRQDKRQKAQDRQKHDEGKKIENEMVKGTLLHLKGFATDSSREDIKNLLQDFGQIAWVDFKKGDMEGWVRYDTENQAKEVLAKVKETWDGPIPLNGAKLEANVLEGEEEVERFKAMYEEMINRRDYQKKKKHQYENPYKKVRYGRRPCKDKRNAAKAELAAKHDAEETSPTKRPAGAEADGEPEVKVAKTDQSDAAVDGEPKGKVTAVDGQTEAKVTAVDGEPKVKVTAVDGEPKVKVTVVDGEPKIKVTAVDGEPKVKVTAVEGQTEAKVMKREADDSAEPKAKVTKSESMDTAVDGQVKVMKREAGDAAIDSEPKAKVAKTEQAEASAD